MNLENPKGSTDTQVDSNKLEDAINTSDELPQNLKASIQNAMYDSKLNNKDLIQNKICAETDIKKNIENDPSSNEKDISSNAPLSNFNVECKVDDIGSNQNLIDNNENKSNSDLNQNVNDESRNLNTNTDIQNEMQDETTKQTENHNENDCIAAKDQNKNQGLQNDEDTEKKEEEEKKEPVDDFAYLKYDRETFTNPVLRKKWEDENQIRFKQQEEEEKRMMEEMAKRAQQQREAFLKQVQKEQEQRKSKNAKIKPPPSKNENGDDEIDSDDPVAGWSQVMKMAKPMKKDPNQSQLKNVRKLYFSMKS